MVKTVLANICWIQEKTIFLVAKCIREAFIKKNILLLTFVNKDFTPPLIIDEKPLRFGGPVKGVTPPFIKVKNNIV